MLGLPFYDELSKYLGASENQFLLWLYILKTCLAPFFIIKFEATALFKNDSRNFISNKNFHINQTTIIKRFK
jgi:hypothetical protein